LKGGIRKGEEKKPLVGVRWGRCETDELMDTRAATHTYITNTSTNTNTNTNSHMHIYMQK